MELRNDITVYGKMASSRAGYVAGRVEVTSDCFQRCKLCDSWRDHQKGTIRGCWQLDQMQELVRQSLEFPHFAHLTLTGGDPQAWGELQRFLEWMKGVKSDLAEDGRPFNLQVNTAFLHRPEKQLWLDAVDRIWVSLDAVDQDVYKAMRGIGGARRVLDNMMHLAHPRYSTMTTVCEENIDQIPKILGELGVMRLQGLKLHKAMFLAAIDHRKSEQDSTFWHKWREFARTDWGVPTSFVSDSVDKTRRWCKSPEARKIRCWTPLLTYYFKANLDLYPCCLVGGEAVRTQQAFKIGNFVDKSLRPLWQEQEAQHHYHKGSPCIEFCQYKQACLNIAGEAGAAAQLAMP